MGAAIAALLRVLLCYKENVCVMGGALGRGQFVVVYLKLICK